jgi:exodeoxyribonuclease V beta subunit
VTAARATPFAVPNADLGPGRVLLEASAGTGKTYTLVGILLRLLLEQRIERLDQALVVTFTIAATEELKTRVRAALERTLAATQRPDPDPFFRQLAAVPCAAARVREALLGFDQVAIATIHGFCKRVLEEAAFESREPFHLDFAADPVVLLEQAAADTLRACYDDAPTPRTLLLHEKQVKPKTLVEWYRLWQRYPDVRLQPERSDLDARLAAIADALPRAVEAFDACAAQQLARARWKKDQCPFDGFEHDAAAALAAFGRALRTDPARHVATLASVARCRLADRVHKNVLPLLTAQFFAACDPIANAFDGCWAHLRTELLLRMHDRVSARKRADHVLSFDDLLRRTHAALRDPQRGPRLCAALQARYRTALIDEFQDTDRLQFEIFDACFGSASLFLVGDPKQAIYGFRGADLRTYLAARDGAQRVHTLAVNHRSSEAMVRAVNRLFAGRFAFATAAIDVPQVRAHAAPGGLALEDPAGGEALCWRYVTAPAGADDTEPLPRDAVLKRVADDVAAEIVRLLRTVRKRDANGDERPVRPRDIAVLTRRNVEAVLIQQTLRRANVHAAIGKAGDVFETDEVDELDRFVHAVLQPGNLAAVRGALATRWCGLDAAAVQALDADDRALEQHLERFDRWRRIWVRSGFVPMIEQATVELAVVRRYLALQGGERRLTNVRQLVAMMHEAESVGRRSPEGLLEWLRRERANQDDLDYTVRELRLESDGDAVQILTMHGSKGLEYEIVFCPFLWGGVYPRRTEVVEIGEAHHGLAFDVGKESGDFHLAMAGQLGEDLRLAYVALTRARRRCYVHFGNAGSRANGSWRCGLAWLLGDGGASVGEPPWPDDWASVWANGSKQHAAKWPQRLEALVHDSGGAMALALVPDEPVVEPLAPEPLPPLRPAERPGRVVRARGMHSFTSIVAGAPPLDAVRDVADPAAYDAALPPLRGVHAFARGAAAGQCLHDVLEHVDLGALEPEATRTLVRATLAAHGLAEPSAHAGDVDPVPAVVQLLHDVAAARLPDGPTLGVLCGGARQAEWEFLLPAERAAVPALAALFAASGSAIAAAQAERLRALPAPALRGFLLGFVDLVAEHDGRFWVLDWKSNHLGADGGAYGDGALRRAMVEHDYVLQYHLYVLALHRHLRRRRDYDPARHLGGVCYVFLRGVQPGANRGLFVDRVPPALVEAMDRWLGGGERGGAP